MIPRFAGQTFQLGGETRVIPPLALGQVRTFAPQLREIGALPVAEQTALLADVIHAALSRNYPETARAWLDEVLDLGNIHVIALAVMGASGLTEGKAATGATSTGTDSTPG